MVISLVEPNQSEKHRQLSITLIKDIETLIIGKKNQVVFKPSSLIDKPFSVKIVSDSFPDPLNVNVSKVKFKVVLIDDRKEMVVPKFGLTIEFTLPEKKVNITAIGRYGNFTKKNTSEEYQFQGATAFFSPIDDAISQAMANVYQTDVLRTVQTRYSQVESDFLSRGFKKLRDAEDGMAELEKAFLPPSK